MSKNLGAKGILVLIIAIALSSIAYAAVCTSDLYLALSNPNPTSGGSNFKVYLYDNGCSGFPPPGNCWNSYTTATLEPLPAGLSNITGGAQALNPTTEAPYEWTIDGSSSAGDYQVDVTLSGAGTCTANISFTVASAIADPNIKIGIPVIPRQIIGQPYSMIVEFNNTGSGAAQNISGNMTDLNSITTISDSGLVTSLAASTTGTTKTYTVTPNTGGNSTMKLSANYYYKEDGITKVTNGAGDFYLTFNQVPFYVNRNPVFSGNLDADIDFSEDGNKTLNLNNYASDGTDATAIKNGYENTASDLIWSYTAGSGTINLNITLDLDADQIIVTSPGNQSGYQLVTFNITDSDGVSASQQVTITVSGSNDAPIINCTINDQNKNEDDAPWTLDLADCKHDVESIEELNNPSLLDWSVEDVDTSLFSANFNSDIITFTPVANASGSDAIILRLTDSEGGSAVKAITVNLAAINDPPTLQPILNQVFSEGDFINITPLVNVSDVDGTIPAITYSSVNLRANSNLQDGLWNTSYNDSGKYLIKVTADDSELSVSQEFKLTINNIPQGANDTTNGNVSDVKSSYANLGFEFDGIAYDGTQTLLGNIPVKIKNKDNNQTIVEFDWSFSNTSTFDFNSMIVNSTFTSGSEGIVVSGIDLTSQGTRKTIYLNQTNTTKTAVCIKDAEISSIEEMTSTCTGTNENIVYCDGQTRYGYTCTALGSVLKITGLIHSGARQNPRVVVNGDGICDDDEDCSSSDCSGADRCKSDDGGVDPGYGGGGGGYFTPPPEEETPPPPAETPPEETTPPAEEESAEETTPTETTPEETTEEPEAPGNLITGAVVGLLDNFKGNPLVGFGIIVAIVALGIGVYIYIFKYEDKPKKKKKK